MSYVNLVHIDDGSYTPGYRGDFSKARASDYVDDEIAKHATDKKYLNLVNDLAVMENSDITKVPLYDKPMVANITITSDSDDTNDYTLSLWLIFLVFIAFMIAYEYYETTPDDVERYPQF